jgi:hypothetical protein
MAKRRKSFDDWTAQDIRYTFGIKEKDKSSLLEEWLSKSFVPNAIASSIMEERREELNRHFRSWNEDELKFQFIAQIVILAKLHGEDFSTFSQRNLSAVYKDVLLQGRPEVMVATGIDDPVRPYFFIHEYKPTKQTGDPLGQVLAAMLAAFMLNGDEKPIFGCFVIGNTWQFVILEANFYTISRSYDANQADDLQDIYSALCQAKVYIEERIKS